MAHANGEGGPVGAANPPFLVEAERWTVASATYRELLAAAQLARTLPKDAPAEPDQKVRPVPQRSSDCWRIRGLCRCPSKVRFGTSQALAASVSAVAPMAAAAAPVTAVASAAPPAPLVSSLTVTQHKAYMRLLRTGASTVRGMSSIAAWRLTGE